MCYVKISGEYVILCLVSFQADNLAYIDRPSWSKLLYTFIICSKTLELEINC